VTSLLDRGANVNARDTVYGRTPLVFATSANRIDAMKVLIARGADVKAGDDRCRLSARDRPADNQSRQARDRIVSATTGRATNSGININDPPPPGAAGANQGRGRRRVRVGVLEPGRACAMRSPTDIEQIGRQGGFTALHYACP
jgi:hypothetical protein